MHYDFGFEMQSQTPLNRIWMIVFFPTVVATLYDTASEMWQYLDPKINMSRYHLYVSTHFQHKNP